MIKTLDGRLHILNFHGISLSDGKTDNPMRIEQSQKIIDFLKTLDGEFIVGGDFNLREDTQSVEMFEKQGYRNLIKDFNIKSTRNKIAFDKYTKNPLLYCDYVFTSPKLKISGFEVPYNEYSDHLPMILDLEL